MGYFPGAWRTKNRFVTIMEDRVLNIDLTEEEAYELLFRCLQSTDQDTPVFQSALKRIANALQNSHAEASEKPDLKIAA